MTSPDFDWDQEAAKARDAFLHSDSSYQTTGSYCAGRDAWDACLEWVKRQALLKMLGVPADERTITTEAIGDPLHVEVEKRFKVYDKDADFIRDTRTGVLYWLKQSGATPRHRDYLEPDWLIEKLVAALNEDVDVR